MNKIDDIKMLIVNDNVEEFKIKIKEYCSRQNGYWGIYTIATLMKEYKSKKCFLELLKYTERDVFYSTVYHAIELMLEINDIELLEYILYRSGNDNSGLVQYMTESILKRDKVELIVPVLKYYGIDRVYRNKYVRRTSGPRIREFINLIRRKFKMIRRRINNNLCILI